MSFRPGPSAPLFLRRLSFGSLRSRAVLVLVGFALGQIPWRSSRCDTEDVSGDSTLVVGLSQTPASAPAGGRLAVPIVASAGCVPPMFPERKLGVVWHLVEKDHTKVPKRLADWALFTPCNPSCGYPRHDLVFWFNRRLDDYPAVSEALQSYVAAMDPKARACFGDVLYLSAGLTADEDTYVKHEWHEGVKINKSIPLTQGPNLMFQRMLDSPQLRALYEYVFAVDAETAPLRPFWLDKVFLESNAPSEFWMKGSVQRISREYFAAKSFPLMIEKRFHLNGNALFRLDDELSALVRRLRETRGEYPYDYLLQDFITDPAEWIEVQEVLHYFVFSDFIQNRKSDPRPNRQRRAEFLARYPNTYLEHR